MNNPNSYAYSGEIDIAAELSKKLGMTVKQGSNFRVVGYGASLVGGAGDLDTGMAASVRMQYCPTNSHSAQAWRQMAGHYQKQTDFRRGLASQTKYDEFEVAHHDSGIDSRTSTVYVGGISDPAPEHVVIYGIYDDEDGAGTGYIGLSEYYKSKYPVPSGGQLVEEDLLFDDTIDYKPPKFGTKFPEAAQMTCTATFSSALFYDHDILIDDIYDSGAVASDSMHYLPSDNHLDVMCGRLAVRIHALARDDENILADSLYVWITIDVEGWSSLWTTFKLFPKKMKSWYGKSRRRWGRS